MLTRVKSRSPSVSSGSIIRHGDGWSTIPSESGGETLDGCEGCAGSGGIEHGRVAAIGITNQRETIVVWDRATGEPIHRAIVWQDRRTADVCAQLKADGAEQLVRERDRPAARSLFLGDQDRLDPR